MSGMLHFWGFSPFKNTVSDTRHGFLEFAGTLLIGKYLIFKNLANYLLNHQMANVDMKP